MHLHYNQHCTHQHLPTKRLRILCANEQYDEALLEIGILNNRTLNTRERLVLNIHEILARLAKDQASYAQAKERLEYLASFVRGVNDPEFTAQFQAQQLILTVRCEDHAHATHLIQEFFAVIARTPVTEAYLRMACGINAYRLPGAKAADAAIRWFVMALGILKDANNPCLKETIARHLAFCLQEVGDTHGAITALRSIGLLASLEPSRNEIALADLLVVPGI